jgi:hypothetical protein
MTTLSSPKFRQHASSRFINSEWHTIGRCHEIYTIFELLPYQILPPLSLTRTYLLVSFLVQLFRGLQIALT